MTDRLPPPAREHAPVTPRTRPPCPRRCLAAELARASSQRGIGLVDLRHLAGGDARCLRIVARQVRVVLTGEAPPRRLDLGWIRARLDAQDDVGFAFGHVESVS